MEKVKKVEVEKNLDVTDQRIMSKIKQVKAIKEEDSDQTENAEVPDTICTNSPSKAEAKLNQLCDLKDIIEDKGASKDWQERELALKAMSEVFSSNFEKKDVTREDFLQNCVILLKSALEENNMTIYLQAIEVASLFFEQTLGSDVVYESLASLVQPIVLRTTDTNTRIRKKSVDLINQIWDYKYHQSNAASSRLKVNNLRDSQEGAAEGGVQKTDSVCQIIAQVITDPNHGEKAIIGRLGLFIKRALHIEGSKDLQTKPLQVIIGKNYE